MSTGTDGGAPLLDASIRLDSLPSDGRTLSVKATPEQREAIAEHLGVSRVDALSADLKAVGFRGGIRVTGTIKAEITQPCVVTFEPVTQFIEESIDRIFLPGHEAEYQGPAGAEVFVDLEGEDLPDHFEGPEVDLSALLLEVLSLAVDPYPRKPGVSIDQQPETGEEDTSPFAKLKSLKQPRD